MWACPAIYTFALAPLWLVPLWTCDCGWVQNAALRFVLCAKDFITWQRGPLCFCLPGLGLHPATLSAWSYFFRPTKRCFPKREWLWYLASPYIPCVLCILLDSTCSNFGGRLFLFAIPFITELWCVLYVNCRITIKPVTPTITNSNIMYPNIIICRNGLNKAVNIVIWIRNIIKNPLFKEKKTTN